MGIYDKYQCLSFFIEVIACVISNNLYKPLIILLSFTKSKTPLLDTKITSCYAKHTKKHLFFCSLSYKISSHIFNVISVLNLGLT